jgi:hypothetical protein
MALPDNIKFALDNTLNIPYKLGLRPYRVFAVKIEYTGTRPGLGTRTRIDTEILIGDGYPICNQVSAHDVFSSGGLLNDKDFKLTVIDPYSKNGIDGYGTSEDIWQPQPNNKNIQIYFHIFGGGFPAGGQYFKKKYSVEDCNLTSDIFLEATAEIPGV